MYKGKEDFYEGLTEIFTSLAAKYLLLLLQTRSSKEASNYTQDYVKRVVDFLKRADDVMKINEYTWLVKGFFEIIEGELSRAEEHFKSVQLRATKVQNVTKKRFLFGSLVGLVQIKNFK